MRLLTTASITALCALSASGQTLLRSVPGPAADTEFGKSCIVVSDQNGDGYKDVLVGAPGFNQERGAIYCVSGAHMATGQGLSILWSLAPAANPGDRFGASLAEVGDVTGDGVADIVVGQPGFDDFLTGTSGVDRGAIRLVHGASHTVVSLIHGSTGWGLGVSLAACGDLNLNGFGDVVIGSVHPIASIGVVSYVDGSFLTQSLPMSLATTVELFDYGTGLGTSVASGHDLTGDGKADVVIGAPKGVGGGPSDAGKVVVWDVVTKQFHPVYSFVGGEHVGSSVSIGDDYDGDGVADIVAGAPDFPDAAGYRVGRAVVYSGARVVAQTPPYEVYSFHFPSGQPPTHHTDPDPDFHFGTAVEACADLNGDGVGEILVGAPGYFTQTFFPTQGWSFRGQVRLYSGATGAQLASINGSSTDRIGDALNGRIGDLNGDGFAEFLLAGSLSDVGGLDSGVLKSYRLFPLTPTTYCFGKLNSLGCTPGISISGSPSESSSSPFLVNAANLINQKNGLLFYSRTPTAVAFQGGTLCVASPTRRTATQHSGGATSGASCSGVFSFDFNAWIRSGADPSLVTGAEVFAQYWSRDPQSPSSTNLTNALRFVVNP